MSSTFNCFRIVEFAHLCGLVDPASPVVLEFAFFVPPSCVWSFIFNFVALFVRPPIECHDAISGANMSIPRLAQPVLGQVQHPPEKFCYDNSDISSI